MSRHEFVSMNKVPNCGGSEYIEVTSQKVHYVDSTIQITEELRVLNSRAAPVPGIKWNSFTSNLYRLAMMLKGQREVGLTYMGNTF